MGEKKTKLNKVENKVKAPKAELVIDMTNEPAVTSATSGVVTTHPTDARISDNPITVKNTYGAMKDIYVGKIFLGRIASVDKEKVFIPCGNRIDYEKGILNQIALNAIANELR